MLNPQPMPDDDEMFDYDTFRALVVDGQKADLIDGVIYMASPDSYSANDKTCFLATLMRSYVSKRKLQGKVFVNRFAHRLDEYNAPEPDVSFVRSERLHLISEGGMHGAPDITVEIVAKESRDRDMRIKRNLYELFGVTEYWIIDYLQRQAEFLRLENGKYQTVTLEHKSFIS